MNQGLSISRAQYATGNMDVAVASLDIYFSANYTQFFSKLTLTSGVTLDRRNNNFEGTLPEFFYAMRPDNLTVSYENSTRIQVSEIYMYGKYDLSDRWQAGIGFRKIYPFLNKKAI